MSDEIERSEVTEPVETTETAELEAETTEEVVEESAPSEDAEEAEKPKRRSRAEERIHALTREKYEAQKQAEAYQRQLAEVQRYFQQQQMTQNVGDDLPSLADFNYDESAYKQAIGQWNQKQIERYQANLQQSWQQQQAQQAQMAEAQKLQTAMSKGQEKYPDFVSAVTDPNLPPLREVNPAAFQAVMDSDAGVDVAYYLAKNPSEVYALASMTPVQAIKRVAQIEAQLNNKPVTSRQPPKPPSRVSGNSEAVKDPSKMTTSEWMAWRNAQVSKR